MGLKPANQLKSNSLSVFHWFITANCRLGWHIWNSSYGAHVQVWGTATFLLQSLLCCVWSRCPRNTRKNNFMALLNMFQVKVWHSHSFVCPLYSPIPHIPLTSSDLFLSFILLLCCYASVSCLPECGKPLSLQSAHINNKITSCSLLLRLAIILQLKSCRELEAKWMLWRMLMCVEWEHCLPLARWATAPALNISFQRGLYMLS